MSDQLDVSVVIPAYNAVSTILEAMESVRLQTEPPEEVIVVDDGSTDDTAKVVTAYIQSNALISWRLITQINLGAASARDTGIRRSKAAYIALLDADDHWLPQKLAVSMCLLARDGLDLVGASVRSLDDTNACRTVDKRELLFKNPFFTSTVVFRKSAYQEIGGFDRKQRHSEDYKLWLTFGWRGKKCGLMRSAYAVYRPKSGPAHAGLSSQLWKMQCCESRNFRFMRQCGLAPSAWCLLAQTFSWLKFIKRLLVQTLNYALRWQNRYRSVKKY